MSRPSNSELIEHTRQCYLENLLQSGKEVHPADERAIQLVASAAVYRMSEDKKGEPFLTNVISTMYQWAMDFHPEKLDELHQLFDDPKTARNISRVVSAHVVPAGSYEPEELLEGLRTGKVLIDIFRENQ